MAPRTRAGFHWAGLITCLCLLCGGAIGHSAEAPAPGTGGVATAESGPTPATRSQEQQDVIQQAIEQTRREADAAARRNAEVLTERLGQIQQSLETQHRRELEAVQSSNRTTLLVAGVLAAAGFLGMFCLAFFLMRATNRLTEAAMTGPLGHALVSGHGPDGLRSENRQLTAGNPADVAGARFLGAIEQLEKRLQELEQSSQSISPADLVVAAGDETTKSAAGVPPAHEAAAEAKLSLSVAGDGSKVGGQEDAAVSRESAAESGPDAHVAVLLAKGQTLLNLDKAEEALACFDEALVRDPRHAEGLVKKGTALERLGRTEAALECYDRAIAVDGSLTTAYLHKGGVFNRLERYEEALKCYEQALLSEQKSVAPVS